jgi:2-polyprenyl-3-methyl-5-hydroxy-6-metoxy-1,4-benzoquinol methylase
VYLLSRFAATCWDGLEAQKHEETMPDLHYEHPDLAALYDIDCGWSEDRDFYLSLASKPPQRVLDLGCGTGLICDAYAALGHDVTGADPAPAMLEIARHKPHGEDINWVLSTAQDFRSTKRFDLIIMTSHAFQVLLEDDDIRAAFDMVRAHLAPSGRFVFESRNPAIDWFGRWNSSHEVKTDGRSVTYTLRSLYRDNNKLTFEQRYDFDGQSLTSRSELLFLTCEGIQSRLRASGLRVESVFGNWQSEPFDPATSHEMIFSARLA